MKNILFLTVFLLSLPANSQEASKAQFSITESVRSAYEHPAYANMEYQYRPFLVEGKRWENKGRLYDGTEFIITYVISGDTVIGGEIYKKMFIVRTLTKTGHTDTPFLYLLMEKDRKVYRGPQWQQTLYDFSLNVGDSLISGDNHVYVTAIDTIKTAAGQLFRRMHIHVEWKDENGVYDKPGTMDTYWVEGVGGRHGPINSYEMPSTGYTQQCYEDGVCIFTKEDFDRAAWKGEESAIAPSSIPVPSPATNAAYDLQGRRITSTPRPGIYIYESRKRVVR